LTSTKIEVILVSSTKSSFAAIALSSVHASKAAAFFGHSVMINSNKWDFGEAGSAAD
jgi:hypothetical protein